MSNFRDDEEMRRHAKIFHQTLKKLQDENTRKLDALNAWKVSKDPGKPNEHDFHMLNGGQQKSEKEMVKIAQQTADEKTREQQKLEKMGLVKTQDEAKIKTAEQEKARARKERRLERKKLEQTKKRDRGRTLGM